MSININDTDINIFDIEEAMPEEERPSHVQDVVVDGSPGTKARRMEEIALQFLHKDDAKPTTGRYMEQPADDELIITAPQTPTKPIKNSKKKRASRPSRAKARAPSTPSVRDESELIDESETQNEDEEIQKRIIVLNRYKNSNRFSEYLKEQGFKFTALNKKSLEELDSLVNKIRFTVNNKDDPNLLNDEFFKQIFGGLEAIITKKTRGKVDLTGMTSVLFTDEQFLDDIEKFRLEYLGFCNMDYRVRMAWTVTSTALRVSAMNAMMKRQNAEQ